MKMIKVHQLPEPTASATWINCDAVAAITERDDGRRGCVIWFRGDDIPRRYAESPEEVVARMTA